MFRYCKNYININYSKLIFAAVLFLVMEEPVFFWLFPALEPLKFPRLRLSAQTLFLPLPSKILWAVKSLIKDNSALSASKKSPPPPSLFLHLHLLRTCWFLFFRKNYLASKLIYSLYPENLLRSLLTTQEQQQEQKDERLRLAVECLSFHMFNQVYR